MTDAEKQLSLLKGQPTPPQHIQLQQSEHHVKISIFLRMNRISTTSLWCPQPLHQVFNMGIRSPPLRLKISPDHFQHQLLPSLIIFQGL